MPDLPPAIYVPIAVALIAVIKKLWSKWQTCEKVIREDLRQRLDREEFLQGAGKEQDDETRNDS